MLSLSVDLQCDDSELHQYSEDKCAEADVQEVPSLPDAQARLERPDHARSAGLMPSHLCCLCHLCMATDVNL